jgi:hypothetical protein
MKNESGYYKHYIPDIKLSIEKGTDKVPNDGKYYIVSDGHIIDAFKSRKQAEEKFKQLIEASGYKPSISQKKKLNPGDETIERYLISKAIFWAEGPRYKDKRGKGGRGGV